jgi:tetratricopeptide (TPR) repeat protein
MKKHDDNKSQETIPIDLTPKNADYHNNLGLTHYKLGELTEAAACYKQAIDLAPKNADYSYALVTVHEIQCKLTEAEAKNITESTEDLQGETTYVHPEVTYTQEQSQDMTAPVIGELY